MNLLFDSFWRAAAYCLRPRVVLLSLLPLGLVIGLTVGLGYFFWDPALDLVRSALDASSLLNSAWTWLEGMGMGQLKTVLAPLIVIFAVTPLIVVATLLLVAILMTPLVVDLVVQRRFPGLERRNSAAFLRSLAWSIGSTLAALLALLLSIPLWFVPPLILVLPPLIWGWLTYRVMAYDALAEHAQLEERRAIFKEHQMQLLMMGVVCGFLGAAPSLVWASGVLFAAAFVLLVPLAIWIYTLVFAFASLWFTHYCLAALEQHRSRQPPSEQRTPAEPPPPLSPDAVATVSGPPPHFLLE
ncbi:MAG: EI24 domain-containing protein [Rhodoferax sp.]|nr:EI24 domain-containing protein [Rhodoferax sp.]